MQQEFAFGTAWGWRGRGLTWKTKMDQCLGIPCTKYSSTEAGISLSEHFREVNLGFNSELCRMNRNGVSW